MNANEQPADEAVRLLDESQLLIPFSRERSFEETKNQARILIQKCIERATEHLRERCLDFDAEYEKGYTAGWDIMKSKFRETIGSPAFGERSDPQDEWMVAASNEIVDTLEDENLTLNKSEWVGEVHQIIREAQPQRREQKHIWGIDEHCERCGLHLTEVESRKICKASPRGQQPEWTPEMVQETLKDRPFAASTIASHHNAALAAERQQSDKRLKYAQDWKAEANILNQQLLTERQRREQAGKEMRAMNDQWAQIHTLLGTHGGDDWDTYGQGQRHQGLMP